MLIVAVLPQVVFAQGDGPRTHWKNMLTKTNLFSLTNLNSTGNSYIGDPTFGVVPDANFDAELTMVGYSRSFSLRGRTAVGSILVPVGNLQGEFPGPSASSTRGFGDPILQLDINLIGTPAMENLPGLMRYEPEFTVDLVMDLAFPIGEYDGTTLTNIGQNRWYGRLGVPIMKNLCDWVPGRRRTFEILPAVWFFGDNDEFLGQTLENDVLFQLDAHLTQDFTETFWGSLDLIWYEGAQPTIGGLPSGGLNELGLGFTLGYQINDNLLLTAGYTATLEDGPGDLDLGVFRLNLVYGWHKLLEGIDRLEDAM